ncbi:MAG: 16S rRNA (uracil(1498)-N(3))-methyltransferase [Xanthomonadaceae bacterium]|nr:16S rRNA (uracil(1498)-N(3))-methyltransferase [Xanthomonadaceae bacterium]
MRLTRIHVDHPLAVGQSLALPEAASQHLIRVLRLGVGDECVLFNGDGFDYRAVLESAAKKSVTARLAARERVACESPLRVVLAQALARGEKMDWVLQKATELGVAAIAPIITEHTEVRLDAERGERRMSHWRGVIAAACQQCGRAQLPQLSEPRALADWAVSVPPDALRLALHPGGQLALGDVPAPPSGASLILVVGPEGGLSERDMSQLQRAGFSGLRLGPRVLRTETAGLAALAALQARLGDLG